MAERDVETLLLQRDWLLRLASALVGNRDEAEDAVQTTMTAVVQHGLPADRPAAPWLARVLRNAIRMGHRSRQRRERRERDAAVVHGCEVPTPEQVLERARAHEILARAIVELPDPYRRTLLLRYERDLDTAEVAEIEGISPATVRWRIHQGLGMLRDRLKSTREGCGVLLAVPSMSSKPIAGIAGTVGSVVMKKAVGVLAVTLLGATAVVATRSATHPVSADPGVKQPERLPVETRARELGTSSEGEHRPREEARRSSEPASASTPEAAKPPTSRQAEWATSFRGLYHRWNPSWVADNMRESASAITLEELLEWFRSRLGACGEPVAMVARDEYARFLYPCDEGELEVGFASDASSDRVRTLLLGAREVEPPEVVRRSAEAALRLIETWNDRSFHDLFEDSFDPEETKVFFESVHKARGSCALEGVDLANARGALWFIACESGPALMKTDLGEDDRIRVFFIQDRRPLRPDP